MLLTIPIEIQMLQLTQRANGLWYALQIIAVHLQDT